MCETENAVEGSLAHDFMVGNDDGLRDSTNGPSEFDVRTLLTHDTKLHLPEDFDHLAAGNLRGPRHESLTLSQT